MRSFQQKRILGLVETFREAVEGIGGLLQSGNAEAASELLEDCLGGAAWLRGFVDESKGMGTRTAALLDEYISEIERSGAPNAELTNRLIGHLKAIEESVIDELKPDRLEIVFLPYKASMWDSLESIWLAARDDPRCDAYVVPIPYYDRLPGGRRGRMHYEGDQYPDYVPVTRWQDYSIEERYPDAVFIHNPYDGGNTVTTVHPDYYSAKLRDQTDLLCYVPYFVTGSSIGDNFCTCEGIVNAHRVFLESEHICGMYRRALLRYWRNNHQAARAEALRGKYVPLGSPKYDRVISARPEEFTLPDGWRRLLEREDGTRKMAMLYNTSLGAMLTGGEQYLKKLEAVHRLFKGRGDVALWWRPHPLSGATMDAMLPALRERYLGLLEGYRRGGWGILDETADLHRALCLTSAFYGDGSSLMPMYQLTGKPLMLQNIWMCPGDATPWHNITPGNLCECGGYYWFSAERFNGLFRMDKRTRKAAYMGAFPGESISEMLKYYGCAVVGERLYFVPASASAIAVYDTRTGIFERVELPEAGVNAAERTGIAYFKYYKFVKALERENVVYFIPSTYPGILALDTRNNGIEVIDGWMDALGRIRNTSNDFLFSGGVFEGGSLFLACASANAVMEIDVDTRAHKLHRLGGNHRGYQDILVSDGAFYLLPIYEAGLVRWDPASGSSERYAAAVSGGTGEPLSLYQRIERRGNNLYLIPYVAPHMLHFDMASKTLSVEKGFIPENGGSGRVYIPESFIYMEAPATGGIFAFTARSNTLVEYDPHTGSLREDAIAFEQGDLERLRGEAFAGCGGTYGKADDYILWEQPVAGIEGFIDMMTSREGEQHLTFPNQARARGDETAHPYGGAGEAIYAHVRAAALGV